MNNSYYLSMVPIQDHTHQLEIYEVFNLVIPHRNFSACYNIDSKYLGITYKETKAVKISEQQFSTCQKTNGQFCSINAPLHPLANPPSCNAAIHAKNKAGIEKRCSLQIRNTNSVSISMPITPNMWILTSSPTMAPMVIMLICPELAPRFIKNTDTHPHSSTTTSMQHYITTFSSTAML